MGFLLIWGQITNYRRIPGLLGSNGTEKRKLLSPELRSWEHAGLSMGGG